MVLTQKHLSELLKVAFSICFLFVWIFFVCFVFFVVGFFVFFLFVCFFF